MVMQEAHLLLLMDTKMIPLTIKQHFSSLYDQNYFTWTSKSRSP